MPLTKSQQLDALSDHLARRRPQILAAWRKAADIDPAQTTAHALTRAQFNDHIPGVLDAFEQKLRSRPGSADAREAGADSKKEEVKHGLHRWQQGYRLQELMREWGHLQLCLFDEFNAFAASEPEFESATLVEAIRQTMTLVNEAIRESAAQYERMQRAEAVAQIDDLTVALSSVNEIERRRSSLIHEAVHDLNGDVFGATVAAKLLGGDEIVDTERVEFVKFLECGLHSATAMLGELLELARLEAGQESREITRFDAAALVTETALVNRPRALERGLFLEVKGRAKLSVEGDSGKVRRLLQNLLLNALKYTKRGGVTLKWGKQKENWWLMVKDTGPGMLSGPGAPLAGALKEATASARESDVENTPSGSEASQVLTPATAARPEARQTHSQPGEGIGLSIVKRLCELLDASLEMASSAETGTTFRVVFPCHYPDSPAEHAMSAQSELTTKNTKHTKG